MLFSSSLYVIWWNISKPRVSKQKSLFDRSHCAAASVSHWPLNAHHWDESGSAAETQQPCQPSQTWSETKLKTEETQSPLISSANWKICLPASSSTHKNENQSEVSFKVFRNWRESSLLCRWISVSGDWIFQKVPAALRAVQRRTRRRIWFLPFYRPELFFSSWYKAIITLTKTQCGSHLCRLLLLKPLTASNVFKELWGFFRSFVF